MTRQPEQQQQRVLLSGYQHSCPSCPRAMRLVGRESEINAIADLLTFQCDCGQIFTTTAHQ
jgi:hypothetical protein